MLKLIKFRGQDIKSEMCMDDNGERYDLPNNITTLK
jgi:hypothetical protein